MDTEYEFSRTSPEEIKSSQEEALQKTTEIMNAFYDGIQNGTISPEEAEKKDTLIAQFIGSLSVQNENFNPAQYTLYYILTNGEPDLGVEYKFDVLNPIDPHGPGAIQQFIEKNFKMKKL